MEWTVSGNALKTFGRSVTCLARIGNELILQATPSQLALHTLNSSRTPLTSIDHLSVTLPDPDASKVQWTLECYNGMRKTYWITCNIEADVQQLSLDRRRLPSRFVVRPRDLNRLLANFQSTLQEITVIATEPASLPADVADEVRGKAVELRSYIDPTKENDSSLHTQLWIDPSEEFVQYTHTGDPVDVTFGVKELKAFLAFCEGCEVDLHLHFDKAGEPILMAPKFSVEDVSVSNFDATLVLATMLVSQLQTEPIHAAAETEDQAQAANVSEHPSDHTRIWSELSATKSASRLGGRVEVERDQNASIHEDIQRINTLHVSKDATDRRNFTTNTHQPMQTEYAGEPQGRAEISDHGAVSQRHLSNWVDADEDEDDDQGEDSEPYVQATPPYHEE